MALVLCWVQVQGSALMSSSTQAPLSSAASGRRSTASPWLGSTPVNSPPPALGTLRPGTSPGRLPSFTAAAGGGGGGASAAGGSFSAAGGAAALHLLRPGTPSILGAAPLPRGVEVDVPAATAAAAAASAEAAEQQRRVLWEAMAAAEERGTRLWSFLNGLALVPLVSGGEAEGSVFFAPSWDVGLASSSEGEGEGCSCVPLPCRTCSP